MDGSLGGGAFGGGALGGGALGGGALGGAGGGSGGGGGTARTPHCFVVVLQYATLFMHGATKHGCGQPGPRGDVASAVVQPQPLTSSRRHCASVSQGPFGKCVGA